MRHAPCAAAAVWQLTGITATLRPAAASDAIIIDEPSFGPGDHGWYGPEWETDEAGALVGTVQVTSHPGEGDQWLVVVGFTADGEFGWSEGPYPAGTEGFSVPVLVPPESDGKGLVQVFVRYELTDELTGKLRFVQQTPPAYVANPGGPGERWYTESGEDQLGAPIQALGDLDGDGRPDLAFGAPTYRGVAERTGAAYLVPAGPLASGPADDLSFQFHGTELGEGVGGGFTSGDFDADGSADLVIGAPGFVPGRQTGKVLGFLGPLGPGSRGPADADFVVYGEEVFDWFGASVVALDADGDARSDLAVAAQGADSARGRIYLFRGADLLP